MRSFGEATSAFARRFHRDIDAQERNPGRYPAGGAEVVARNQIKRGIRTPACSLHTGLSRAPLRPRHLETRVKVESGQCQRFEIPDFQRPGFQPVTAVSFQESFQADVVEPARVELRRVVGGGNWLWLKPGRAGQPGREENARATIHETDGSLRGFTMILVYKTEVLPSRSFWSPRSPFPCRILPFYLPPPVVRVDNDVQDT